MASIVFPVPGGPTNNTLPASSRNRSEASSRMSFSSTPGWAVKSNASSWIVLVGMRTAGGMSSGGPGWCRPRRPLAAQVRPQSIGPGCGRYPGCRAAPRPRPAASRNPGGRAAADRGRPARWWCSLGLTGVVGWPDRSGGGGVAGEVGHHLLTFGRLVGAADAVGLGQRLDRGWAPALRWHGGRLAKLASTTFSSAATCSGNTRPHRRRRGRGGAGPAPHRCR
jgi:hypothetical protein